MEAENSFLFSNTYRLEFMAKKLATWVLAWIISIKEKI